MTGIGSDEIEIIVKHSGQTVAEWTGDVAPGSEEAAAENAPHYYYKRTSASTTTGCTIDLSKLPAKICADAPIFINVLEDDSITGDFMVVTNVNENTNTVTVENFIYRYNSEGQKVKVKQIGGEATDTPVIEAEDVIVLVDCYTLAPSESKAMELQINAEDFAGYFYVEADTLVRRQSDGRDLPAILTIPLVKIQSNFTIAMASSGDPSTFTFTMDAMPGYTYFNRKKKVLCVFQVIDEVSGATGDRDAVMRHNAAKNKNNYQDKLPNHYDHTGAWDDDDIRNSINDYKKD